MYVHFFNNIRFEKNKFALKIFLKYLLSIAF